MKNEQKYYSVGPLLYCPANLESAADSISSERFGSHFSLTFCLEDTIRDDRVEEAETILINTLQKLYDRKQSASFYMPKIFIRVRAAGQMKSLYTRCGEAACLITGFNAPKFSPENSALYLSALAQINEIASHTVYLMPILENPDMINLQMRNDYLYQIKEKLSPMEEFILNIRVGGNDICNAFGFRRNADETIHDIRPVANLFSDIITVFGRDYVISGPVWEYYRGPSWDSGMKRELTLDRLAGFTGKTVIHPNQIALVNEAYMVSKKDFDDASSILNWDKNNRSLVSGSQSGERMNEYKTHHNWAERILFLSQIYGVKS